MLAALLVPVLAPRPAAPLAAAVTVPRASGDIILSAVIERPATVPPIAARPAQTIVVVAGQTVKSLAAGITPTRRPSAGPTASAPAPSPPPAPRCFSPGPGALVPVLAGERPSHFAVRLGIDPRVLLDYNALSKDSGRPAGSYLQVPLSAAPSGALVGRYFARTPAAVPMIVDSRGPDTFPYGQCTYYVASRRDVTWGGNAWAWFENANGLRPEGHVPVTGAIVVFHDGWFGHVAYVESVDPDNSFVISEMNFWANGGGWGRVDRRTIAGDDRGSLGSSTDPAIRAAVGASRNGVLLNLAAHLDARFRFSWTPLRDAPTVLSWSVVNPVAGAHGWAMGLGLRLLWRYGEVLISAMDAYQPQCRLGRRVSRCWRLPGWRAAAHSRRGGSEFCRRRRSGELPSGEFAATPTAAKLSRRPRL